jgi:hypothetical protein
MATPPASGKKGNSGFVAFLPKVDESMSQWWSLGYSIQNSLAFALNNVRLKPRIIKKDHNCAIEISGCINNVVFSWKWNYFNNSKMYTGIIKTAALI